MSGGLLRHCRVATGRHNELFQKETQEGHHLNGLAIITLVYASSGAYRLYRWLYDPEPGPYCSIYFSLPLRV